MGSTPASVSLLLAFLAQALSGRLGITQGFASFHHSLFFASRPQILSPLLPPPFLSLPLSPLSSGREAKTQRNPSPPHDHHFEFLNFSTLRATQTTAKHPGPVRFHPRNVVARRSRQRDRRGRGQEDGREEGRPLTKGGRGEDRGTASQWRGGWTRGIWWRGGASQGEQVRDSAPRAFPLGRGKQSPLENSPLLSNTNHAL